MGEIYESLKEEYHNSAKKSLLSNKYEDARNYYQKVSNYMNKYMEIKDLSDRYAYDFQSLKDDYEGLVAKYAFSYWLNKEYEKAYSGLEFFGYDEIQIFQLETSDEFWDEAEKRKHFFIRDRSYEFASLLSDEASRNFEKKKWDLSIEGYKKAAEYYEKSKTVKVELVPECLYNCAMAYWNKGNYVSSRKILSEIKSKYPNYYPKDVKKYISESKEAQIFSVAENHRKKASNYFKKEDWINARVSFLKCIEVLKKTGEPDNSNFIGNIRLNIAYTYWNERNYKKAKEKFLEVQEKNPNFEPQLVKEYLEKVEKLIY